MAKEDNATKETLKKAYKSGANAAYRALELANEETLMKRNGYSIAQAREYIRGYQSVRLNPPEETLMRNKAVCAKRKRGVPKEPLLCVARSSGRTAASRGFELVSEEILMERNGYSIEQARAYISGYQSCTLTSEMKKIKNAERLAMKALERGNILTDKNQVLKRHPDYTEGEVEAYLKIIAEKNPSKEDLVRNKARNNARDAANRNYTPFVTIINISQRFKYTLEEAELYVKEYDKTYKDTLKTHKVLGIKQSQKAQLHKSAHELGKRAATSNRPRPSVEEICQENRDFTRTEAQVYLKAYGEVVKRRGNRNVVSGSGINEIIAMEGLVLLGKGQDAESSSTSRDENRVTLRNS